MKLKNIKNLEEFFETVDKCNGDVYLTTKEGDRLNLKSQLTKYITLAALCQTKVISEMDLEVSDPEDMALLVDYSLYEE